MRAEHAATLAARPPRVVWTDSERARLIARAIETQAAHPNLAGLSLIRASMAVLPPSRQRKLIAVTQAPWFEVGVTTEMKRRTAESRAEVDAGSVAKGHAQTAEQLVEMHSRWHAEQTGWYTFITGFMTRMEQQDESQIVLLSLILRELQSLNAKLDKPVPVQSPCECSLADDHRRGAAEASRN